MKLNEKSMALFAGSGAPPDKQGPLYKRGDFNRGFQKRWFVLKGNLLFYYDKRNDKEPIGMIVLEGCTIELSDQEDGFVFHIHFPGSDSRTYVIKADSQEDMEAWMKVCMGMITAPDKVLSCASYDYMRVCVGELKSQLDDAHSTKKLVQSAAQDRKSYTSSMNSWHVSEEPDQNLTQVADSRESIMGRRHNPFDFGDSLEDDGYPGRVSEMRQTRTFQEMHEEYRQQYIEITEDWKKRQKHLSVARQEVVA